MMARRTRFQCKDTSCKKYFDTESKRNNHMKLIHQYDLSDAIKEDTPDLDKEHECGFEDCKFRTNSQKGLKQHRTLMSHGGEPSRSTKYQRAADARIAKAKEDPDLKDIQGALQKAIQENIRLAKELGDLKKERTIVVKSAPIIAQDVYDDMKKLLQGNPNGASDQEKLGLVKCYDIAMEANRCLQADLELARKGLIPEQWITDIKRDLNTSIDMIVAGMRDTVKDRSKIVKFNTMMELLKEEPNE